MVLISRRKLVFLFSLVAFATLVGAFAVNAVLLRHPTNAAAASPNGGIYV